MASTCKKHDWLVDKIYNHPELVGVQQNDIISKTQEYAMLYKGHLLTVPDINFKTSFTDYFVEVKSDGSEFLFRKGMSQLEKICQWNQAHAKPTAPLPKLVMPKKSQYTTWIDMLDDLKYYLPGDLYAHPRHF